LVHAGLAWYNDVQDRNEVAMQELDAEDKQKFEDSMRGEDGWGPDYRANINSIQALLESQFDEDAMNALLNGRASDGMAWMNHPGIMAGLAKLGRQLNPAAAILPVGQGDTKGIADRMKEIEKVMNENRRAYDKDEPMQQEYRDLIDAKLKIEAQEKRTG
jgi:hypothetical protein